MALFLAWKVRNVYDEFNESKVTTPSTTLNPGKTTPGAVTAPSPAASPLIPHPYSPAPPTLPPHRQFSSRWWSWRSRC